MCVVELLELLVTLLGDLPATLLIQGAGVGHLVIHLNAVGVDHTLLIMAGGGLTLLMGVGGHTLLTIVGANLILGLPPLITGHLSAGVIGPTLLMMTVTMEGTVIAPSLEACHQG